MRRLLITFLALVPLSLSAGAIHQGKVVKIADGDTLTILVDSQQLKIRLGKSLLLGLEILVAADIVRTVALEATIQSVSVLGLLVLIRTFLSWALVVEIEGRWPWQPKRDDQDSM